MFRAPRDPLPTRLKNLLARLHIRLLILVLISVAPALVIISYTAWEQRNEARHASEQQFLKVVQDFAAKQRLLMDNSHLFLESLARDPLLRNAALGGPCGEILANLRQPTPFHYSDLFVAGRDGHILCSINPVTSTINVADRTYFRRALAKRDFAVGDFQISRITGKSTVFLAHPLIGRGGEVEGVVAAGIDLDWLHEMLNGASFPQGTVLSLVDSQGTIIARSPEHNGIVGKKIAELALFQKLIARTGQGTMETLWRDGVLRITHVAPLYNVPGGGVYLRIGIPSEAVFNRIDYGFKRNIGTLIFAAGMVLILGWVMSDRLLLRRLSDLTATARRLGAGDLEARPRIPPDGGELGELAKAFEDMALGLQEHQRHIEYLATRDGLTGLPNRYLLMERTTQAIPLAANAGHCLALTVIDIDRFKFINDSLGAPFGDALLRAIAERLQASETQQNTVARLGADEFAMLLTDLPEANSAVAAAARLGEAFDHPFTVNGQEIHVTSSIGIALFPSDGEAAEWLLTHAQSAMRQVKQLGGNGSQTYTSQKNAEASERLKLEQALRLALQRDEFQLHYQPKVDLHTGQISGIEALLRWQNPELGMVSPAHFIPLAEETGLIIPIGEWVMRTACLQRKTWQDAGLTPPAVAVNVSPRQFWHGDLSAMVARVLSETHCDPDGLELEITESVVIRNIDDTVAALTALGELGIAVSMDDFGTGYSSLAYLRRLPLDKLKIDRGFVSDLEHDPEAAVLIREIIVIAHALGLTVITEGVEKAAELDILIKSGCDEVQGYYFSKPLPAEQFQHLLSERIFPGFQLHPFTTRLE